MFKKDKVEESKIKEEIKNLDELFLLSLMVFNNPLIAEIEFGSPFFHYPN